MGGSTQIFSDCTDCAPKSAMNLGFTSYFMQVDESLGDNQFFVGSPGGVNYYLPGCPNYTPGQTSEGESRRPRNSHVILLHNPR